jgi:hypothetical protein
VLLLRVLLLRVLLLRVLLLRVLLLRVHGMVLDRDAKASADHPHTATASRRGCSVNQMRHHEPHCAFDWRRDGVVKVAMQ